MPADVAYGLATADVVDEKKDDEKKDEEKRMTRRPEPTTKGALLMRNDRELGLLRVGFLISVPGLEMHNRVLNKALF